MDKSKHKIIFWTIVGLGVAAAGAAGYLIYVSMPAGGASVVDTPAGRQQWANNIYNNVITNPTAADLQKLLTYGSNYLQAWSDAITNATQTFVLNGVTYSTSTGTVVATTEPSVATGPTVVPWTPSPDYSIPPYF